MRIMLCESYLLYLLMLVLTARPVDVVAPVHQDLLNEFQLGNLESLGYPEPPKSMLNGESMPVNIATFDASLLSTTLLSSTNKYCALHQMHLQFNQMALFWLLILKSLSVTYVVQASGVN